MLSTVLPACPRSTHSARRSAWLTKLSTKGAALRIGAELEKDLVVAALLLSSLAVPRASVRVLDLGCGRGFLAFVLASEGLAVRAVDAHAHASWPLFAEVPDVRARLRLDASTLTVPALVALVTQEAQTAAQCGAALWLVGNRSDELTPWLPWVLATLAVPVSAALVLVPCCPWDYGARYPAAYAAYLPYLEAEAKALGLSCARGVLAELASDKNSVFLMHARPETRDEAARAAGAERRARVSEDGAIWQGKAGHAGDDGY